MSGKQSEDVKKSDLEMTPLKRNLFFSGMILPAPLYFRLGPNSYILIARQNEKAVLTDFQALKDPDSLIYVERVHLDKLTHYLSSMTSKFIHSETLPVNVKAGLVESLTEKAIEVLVSSDLLDTKALKKCAALILELSQKIPHFNDVIARLEKFPIDRSQHGMSTALLSVMIAQEMKMSQTSVHEKLVLASLLLDVGLDRIPSEILQKPKARWTRNELEIYERHPLISAEMVKDIKNIPQDVLIIITESHENSRGTGFPKKIRDVKISPLGKIVGLSNQLLELIAEIGLQEPSKSQADHALYVIEHEWKQPFNKDCFLALKNLANKAFLNKKMK